MISYNGFERRRSQRVIYPFELSYKDPNKNNQGFKHSYGKNISENGILFETYEGFPALTILELKLEMRISETEKKSFSVLAEVVRSEEFKRPWLYFIAVSFCKIDEECRKLIQEYTLNNLDKTPKDNSSLLAL